MTNAVNPKNLPHFLYIFFIVIYHLLLSSHYINLNKYEEI